MSQYNLIISDEFSADFETILADKKAYGTYESNIAIFEEEINKRLIKLTTSPKSGANLNARVRIETAIKYFVIDDYLMFFEIISETEVEVIRLLPARTDWNSKLF